MKRKLSKILGIALTVAMLASLLITASPALALSQPSVTIGNTTISATNVEYQIMFTVDKQLSGNSTVADTITIVFPTGTVIAGVTGSVQAGPGWVEAGPSPLAYNTTSATALGANFTTTAATNTVVFGLPNGPANNKYIGSGAQVLIKLTAGVKNPADPGIYALTVKTSKETTAITSTSYTVVEPTLAALPGVATGKNSAGISMAQATTITAVIAPAGVNGVIEVTSGTYNEALNFNVAGQRIVGIGDGVIIPSTGTVTIAAAGVTLENFIIKCPVTVAAAGTTATISNCTLTENNATVITNAGADGLTISNSTITANEQIGVLSAANTTTVSNSAITVATGGCAIQAGNVTATGNTITGSSGTGISVVGAGSTATLTSNTLKTLNTAITYAGNTIVNATKNVIDSCGSATTNVIIAGSTNTSSFSNNTIQNSNASAYAFSMTAGTINAQYNSILNNTLNVKRTAGTAAFGLNWWGSAAGPATTSISGTVTTAPVLGAAPAAGKGASTTTTTLNAQTTAGVTISADFAMGLGAATKLESNPVVTAPTVLGTGKVEGYWDIYILPGAATTATIKIYDASVNQYSMVYYGGGLSGLWTKANTQGVNVASGYVWFTVSATTTPSITDMTGTPIALVTDKTLAAPALTVAAGATPAIGAYDISVTPTFTWGAVAGADHYQINLCEDPSFTILEWAYNVDTPFFKADEALRNETTYYWRVRGVLDAASTAFTPWATGIFTTEAEAVVAEAPITVEPVTPEVTVEIPPTKITVEPSAPAIPTYLLWIIVVVGAVLVIALIVLIVRTRRVA